MYECRSIARKALGNSFKPKMEEFAQVIRAVADRDKCNDIVAGATIIKAANLQGVDSIMMMAAVVELVEPSNE